MSTLLSTLGRWSFRHPWRVLGSWLLILLVMGAAALGLNKGFDNSISIPGTEAQDGLEQLERTFPQVSGTAAQFIVVAADGDSVEDDAYRDPIEAAVTEFADYDDMSNATSPYGDMVDGLISDDGKAAIVQLQLEGQATTISDDVKQQITDRVHALSDELPDGSTVKLGGDLFATELPAISPTEAVGVIIALLVLIITFRSFVLAGMPLGVALIGVGVALLGVVAATALTDISATTPLLALMLGLAVGIDYALFIAARHQDQVRHGVEPEEAAARATGTAGSAVVFAGVTVLIALIGLGFAGIPFLTVMGIAASVAVAVAVAIAVTLTPAFLGFAKHRATGRPRKVTPEKKPAKGFAQRWVGMVTKHPIVTTLAVVAGLAVVALPALQLGLALPNAGTLPEESEARQAYDLTGEHFGDGFNGPLILTGSIITSTDPLGLMDDLKDAVEEVPGVKEVALATPNETADTGIVQIIPETGPSDPETTDLVHALRDHHDEWLDEFGIDLTVTGFTAVAIDVSAKLGQALLPFGIFVVGLSVVLLMIVFRSIWVPIKAAVGYLLSIVAAFGVVSAVFEWGWGADLLGVAKTGPVIAFMPIVVMGVLFGLAMDYEVFLVSRMREDFVHARKNTHEAARDAVRSGYAASARVVTAAAIIMFAVFVAFVPEGDSNIKPIALALAAGIAIDAFLVRMTLVPAVMTMLGKHAWWMPKWLDKILPRFDIEGEAVEREDQLAGWPGDDSVIAADELTISVDGVPVTLGASTRVAAGSALVIVSEDPRAARGTLLAIAGRLTPDERSKLRVAGHLLPARGAWVRSHVGVALLANETDPLVAIREAARGSDIVAVDGVDHLTRAEADQAAAELEGPATLVLTASSVDVAQALAREAGRTDIVVLELALAHNPEVTA